MQRQAKLLLVVDNREFLRYSVALKTILLDASTLKFFVNFDVGTPYNKINFSNARSFRLHVFWILMVMTVRQRQQPSRHTSFKMVVVYLNTAYTFRSKWRTTLLVSRPYFFRLQVESEVLPLDTVKKENRGWQVIIGETWSQPNNMVAGFSHSTSKGKDLKNSQRATNKRYWKAQFIFNKIVADFISLNYSLFPRASKTY